jgi:hypothetical protein
MGTPIALPEEATMSTTHAPQAGGPGFELRFQSLSKEGQGYAFPCDVHGKVDLDAFSESLRLSYFYARALIGREFAMPAVLPCSWH